MLFTNLALLTSESYRLGFPVSLHTFPFIRKMMFVRRNHGESTDFALIRLVTQVNAKDLAKLIKDYTERSVQPCLDNHPPPAETTSPIQPIS